jgi:N-formylglutamate amidohydrolase
LSRLVFDPERFESDEDEPMARKGMGAVYMRTSDGRPLRRDDFLPDGRNRVIDELFRPYARAFGDLVSLTLESHGSCLIIDCHSFPSRPLPYEDAGLDRPDLCLGFDPIHASDVLIDAMAAIGRRAGWSVGRNVPFAGSYVPLAHYQSDQRVRSVMIELNRARYMNEQTGERSPRFDQVVQLVDALIAEALLIEAYRSTCFEAVTPRGRITLKIDQPSPPLDMLLANSSTASWAFITAWNPRSATTSAAENQHRNRVLREKLRSLELPTFEGLGLPSDPGWEPEESFLVLGVSKELAADLGREFDQNAIVWGEIQGPAMLIDCRLDFGGG